MRKITKQEKNMRLNLLILVVAFAVMAMSLKDGQKGEAPILEFTAVESGYQLQRAAFEGKNIKFIPAGEVEIEPDRIVFRLNGEPLYPWEGNKADEFSDKMLLEYIEVSREIAENGQNPIGVVEAFGEYYLGAEKGGERVFYTLTDLLPTDFLDYDELLMVIESYMEQVSSAVSSDSAD